VRPLLVTGSRGQLGRALLAVASRRGIPAAGHDVDTLDITDREAVGALVASLRPGVIVNCAAFTAVDACEEREEEAHRVNAEAVGHLAGAADAVGALLVQISTDYVFSGKDSRPVREEDPPAPLGAYGRTKLEGERRAALSAEHLIVRTAWLFGHGGNNFVEAILRQVEAGRTELAVVADQTGCPTLADDLAEAILDLVERGARGVVHAVNSGHTTWHGFASEIVRLASHIAQFREFLALDEPVGRRLDFLLQEFLREINTMASKIGDVAVTHLVVEMKNEVERLREQVQNVE